MAAQRMNARVVFLRKFAGLPLVVQGSFATQASLKRLSDKAERMTVQIERSSTDSHGYRLSSELLVAETQSKVFEFFADAFQLETITPPWLHFAVQTPRPIKMHEATVIDYKLRLHGLPIRWRSKISRWEPLFCFVDEQIKGPYRYWHHLHTFESLDGGTLVRDVVHYGVPLSFLLHPLLVRRDLMKIFEYRRDMMGRIFTVAGNANVECPA